jgi:hypothetical protein
MSFSRSIFSITLCAAMLAGCEGTGTGRQLFGTPSSNTIASIQLVFPTQPNRANSSTQVLPLQVNAYDKYGNLITVTYNEQIAVSSNAAGCEVSFQFYVPNSTSSPPPAASSVALTSNAPIAVNFDPACGGPNPATITASATGVSNATVSF